jgi:hypothetical protein
MANEVFRVVRLSDGHELNRFIDLVGACVLWIKNQKTLRVEVLPVGSNTALREIPATECCAALRQWFPQNKNFVNEGERRDMEQWIKEGCGW